jgi:hypothetical protein
VAEVPGAGSLKLFGGGTRRLRDLVSEELPMLEAIL